MTNSLKHVSHGHWPISMHETALLLPPFAFQHHPESVKGHYTWAGHLHPKVSLQIGLKEHHFPCFVLEKEFGILPVFSSFAGGFRVKKTAQNRIYPIVGESLFEIS